MEEKQLQEYKVIYFIGTLHAILHLIVGIIWETVGIHGNSALLSLPYFGGELALVAVCLLLVFSYLILGLRREPSVPVHIRRFCLTLSIVVSVGSLVLIVVMSIRANDYHKEIDAMAKEAYYGAVLMTVVDILATIFFIPAYLYLAISNFRLVKAQEQREKDKQAKQAEEHEPRIQQPASPELEHNQDLGLPLTDRQLQNECKPSEIAIPEDNVGSHEFLQQQHSAPSTIDPQQSGPPEKKSTNGQNQIAPCENPPLEAPAVEEMISPVASAC